MTTTTTATANGQAAPGAAQLPTFRGKASIATILRDIIRHEVEPDAGGCWDYDKVLVLARRKMEAYPAGQRQEVKRSNVSHAFSTMRLQLATREGAAMEKAEAPRPQQHEAPPARTTYTTDELLAARRLLATVKGDRARADGALALVAAILEGE